MTHNTNPGPLGPQALGALLGAVDVSLKDAKYLLALAALGDLDAQFTHRPRNFAACAVVAVEKAVGLALDAAQRAKAVTAVEELLTEAPRFAPDAHPSASLRMHLEMEYEERVWSKDHLQMGRLPWGIDTPTSRHRTAVRPCASTVARLTPPPCRARSICDWRCLASLFMTIRPALPSRPMWKRLSLTDANNLEV